MTYGNVNVDTVTTSTPNGILGAGNASIMKNRIINGAMVIDQRNAGASVTPTYNSYGLDRWSFPVSQNSKFTAQQSSTAPTGFVNSMVITSSSAYSVTSSDYFGLQQKIEGYNIADLGWGTANAKTITISFWVQSSLTGTFGGAIVNYNGSRNYPFTYTISSANTWTQASVTISGDTSGTWLTTTGVGINVIFGLGAGSSWSGTAGAWTGTQAFSATGATSVVGTNGATFYITGVQLEVGSSATGFEYRQYQQELSLCQRYYEVVTGNTNPAVLLSAVFITTASNWLNYGYKQTKRAIPTAAPPSGISWSGTAPTIYPSIDVCTFNASGYFYLAVAASTTAFTFSAEL